MTSPLRSFCFPPAPCVLTLVSLFLAVNLALPPAAVAQVVYPFPCFKPITPTKGCVDQNDNGTFTVGWGYESSNDPACPPQVLAIRNQADLNGTYFNPLPIDQGQPVQTIMGQTGVVFEPGSKTNFFSTTWDGSPLTWNIRTFVVTFPGGFSTLNQGATASSADVAGLCANAAPVCGLAAPQIGTVAGRVTEIKFNGSASSDPEGRQFGFNWDISCNDVASAVTVLGANTATPVVRLAGPGEGRPVKCDAVLTLTDVRNSTVCGVQSAEVAALDCNNQIGGSAMWDQCGVCQGNNSCLDCAGNPFGTATLDRCGQCGGDGSSCISCTSVNQVGALLAIDGNAEAQRRVVARVARKLTQAKRATRDDKRVAKKLDVKAQALYVSSWRITWMLPQVSTTCASSQFCTNSDNSAMLAQYSDNSVELRNTARSLAARIAPYNGSYASRTRRDADRALKTAQEGIKQVPAQQSQCS